MFKLTAMALAVFAIGMAGCTDAVKLKEAPISISGKLSRAGKPVSNVLVWFQPLDHGHLRSLPVTTDGKFQGELIGGNYTYYVGPTATPTSAAALKTIATKYQEPDLRRSVSVEFGKDLILALD